MKTMAAFLLALALAVSTGWASDPLPARGVLVLAVKGGLKVSTDGKKFERARSGQRYSEGAIFRTSSGHADLFFRRIGTMVRILPNSEVRMEKLEIHRNPQGILVKDTLLDLRKGRIITFVRVLFPESKFQVRTDLGIATVAGAGTGRYDIGANGRFVTAKSSSSALKVVIDGNERLIAPGEAYAAKSKKLQPLRPSEREILLIEADELEALAQQLTPPPAADELPPKK